MRNISGPLFGFFLTFAFCVLIVAIPVSCSSGPNCKDPANAANAVCIGEKTVQDCTAPSWGEAIVKYGPQVADTIHGGLNPDGSINWDSIGGKVESAVASFGVCVVADVFGKYVFSKKVAAPGTPATEPTPAAARDAFEHVRVKFPNTSFRTSSGVL